VDGGAIVIDLTVFKVDGFSTDAAEDWQRRDLLLSRDFPGDRDWNLFKVSSWFCHPVYSLLKGK